jgi:hypothetical protein
MAVSGEAADQQIDLAVPRAVLGMSWPARMRASEAMHRIVPLSLAMAAWELGHRRCVSPRAASTLAESPARSAKPACAALRAANAWLAAR